MPSERALVGGGTIYDPTLSGSSLSSYYSFKSWSNFTYQNSVYNSINPGYDYKQRIHNNRYINHLFTGILPYQNGSDKYFYHDIDANPISQIPFYMSFGLPVVLTKYRFWNGFKQNIRYFYASDSYINDLGGETPQDWNLQGSNDGIRWTTLDTRTSQSVLPYATSRFCSNSPYAEYSIGSPAAYKTYKLTVTKGRTAFCNKSGCWYPIFQIGEIQLLGYEDPTTSCSLHGVDCLWKGIRYITSSGTNQSITYNPYNRSFIWAFGTQDSVIGRSDWRGMPARSLPTAYLDFNNSVKLTSYSIKGTGSFGHVPTSWKLYGTNSLSNWTVVDSRSGTVSTSSYNYFNVSSPGSYRYYKIEITATTNYGSDKGGNFWNFAIGDIQLLGTIE